MKRLIITILLCLINIPSFAITYPIPTPVSTIMLNHFDSPAVSPTAVTDITYEARPVTKPYSLNSWTNYHKTTGTVLKQPAINSSGKFGDCLYLDADNNVSDDFCFAYYKEGTSLYGNNIFNNAGGWTIDFWVKIDQRNPSIFGNVDTFIPIIRDRHSYSLANQIAVNSRGFQIYTRNNDTGAGYPVLVMAGININGPPYTYNNIQRYISSTVPMTYGTWHHIEISKQTTGDNYFNSVHYSTGSTYRFFLDGGLMGYIYEWYGTYPFTTINDPLQWIALGGQMGSDIDTSPLHYNQCPTSFDEFRISRGVRHFTHFTPETAPYDYPLTNNFTFQTNGELEVKDGADVTIKYTGAY